MLAWPSRSLTTLTGMPAWMSRLPWVWRRSWSRIRRTFALFTIRRNDSLIACGWTVVPLPVVKTHCSSLSIPTAANSAGLEGAPTVEHGEGRVVERDVAASGLGFAAGLVDFVADRDEPTVERESLLVEVDVGPFETEELVAAHARVRGEPQDREVSVTCRGAQGLAEFGGGPRLAFGALQCTLFGCLGDGRDVASHESTTRRVGEGAPNQQMDLVDGLGVEAAAIGGVEELVVQRFDLLVAQPA